MNKFSILHLILIGLLGCAFYGLLVGFSFDVIAILCFLIVVVVSIFDMRFLLLGWFLMAPYFHMTGKENQVNVAQNLTHVFFVPGLVLAYGLLLPKKNFLILKRDGWYILFLVYLVISGLLSTADHYANMRTIFVVYAIPFMLFLSIQSITLNDSFFKYLTAIATFHLFAMTLIAWFEFQTGKSMFMSAMDWQDLGNLGNARAAGPFSSPIILGVFILFLLMIFLAAYLRKEISFGYFSVCLSIAMFAIFLTFTRSVWLGFIAAILFVITRMQSSRWIKFVLLIGFILAITIATIVLLNNPDLSDRLLANTGLIRLVVAYSSIIMFLSAPVFGIGYGTFDLRISSFIENIFSIKMSGLTTSHVTVLTILAELGVVGMALFLSFFYRNFIRRGYSLRDIQNRNEKIILVCNYGFVIAFIVNAFLIDMRFFSMGYSLLFFSLGIIINVSRTNLTVTK
ncbi:MAG: O-antigen ligase family protein [Bacteroidota bacterium]